MNGRCVAGGWGDPPEPPIPAARPERAAPRPPSTAGSPALTEADRRAYRARQRYIARFAAPPSDDIDPLVDPVGWIEALKAEVADGQLDVLIEAQKPEPPPMTVDEILDESDRWLAEEEAKGRRPPA